jgi:hypothetical protein
MGSTDYNATVSGLGLGDVFAFEEHSERHTVCEASLSVDGSVAHLSYVDGGHDTPAAFRRVFLIDRAPNCPCGIRYEHCENECPWPDRVWEAASL